RTLARGRAGDRCRPSSAIADLKLQVMAGGSGKRRAACSQESGAVRNEFAPRFDLVIALALDSAGDCAASFSNRSASLTFSWNPCDGPSWGLGLVAGSRPARAFVTSSFLA